MLEPDPPDLSGSDSGPSHQHVNGPSAASSTDAIAAFPYLDVDLVMSDASSELSDVPDLKMDSDEDTSSLSSIPSDDENMGEKKLKLTPGVKRATRKNGVRPILLCEDSSDDSDDGSDYEKPKKKRAKKGSSVIKNSNKTGKDKSPVKAKKKGNTAQQSDDERDKVVKKGKVKKPLLAEEAVWADIPDWRERTDCPLFELPVEVLDMVFAPFSSGLGLRDYVSLAGVSRTFRLRLTSTVFQAVASRFNLHSASTIAEIHGTDLSQANRIFSREIEDTRKAPNPPSLSSTTHYTPLGPRVGWSQAQYIVYKEEKRRWKVEERERKRREAEVAASNAVQARMTHRKFIRVGSRERRVLATVQGRVDGEAPVCRNAGGLPSVVGVVVKVEKPISSTSASAEHHINSKSASREPSESIADADDIGARVYDPSINSSWVAPDTDDEGEEERRQVEWDWYTGEQVFFDHYPNQWRTKVVASIKEENLTKRAAMTKYKVTEAELLCLRHHLIKNPSNSKSPQLIFSEAAVGALAFRSHGGPISHATYVQALEKKTREATEERTARAAAKVLTGMRPSVKH